MTTRIAIIGLGRAAQQIHIPACRIVSDLVIVGGYDAVHPQRTFDFPVFDSLDALLAKTHPDIVTIASPTATHYPLARELIERRINVFCEKPFTESVAEAEELVRLSRASGVRLAVNNEYRFMACHRAARDRIGAADFGELTFVHMHQSFRTSQETETGWRGSDTERTCKEFGTHVFDLCRFFFAAEPLRLRARMPRPGSSGGPDLLNLIDLQFPGDRWARITLDRLTRGRHRYLDIRLDGTAGTIETEIGGAICVSAGIRGATRRPYLEADVSLGTRAFLYHGERKRKLAADGLDLFAAATARLLKGYVEALRQGVEPPCHGADNLRTLALMRAAYESAASDRDIELVAERQAA
jgi:predicted dehydrogenase